MMTVQCKRTITAFLAAVLVLASLAGCGRETAESEANSAPAAKAGESAEPVVEEVVTLPPAMPAVGVGRIMPEVVEQRDILICVDPGHGFEDGGSGDAETSV